MDFSITILGKNDRLKLWDLVPANLEPRWVNHPRFTQYSERFWDRYAVNFGNYALISTETEKFLGMKMENNKTEWFFFNLQDYPRKIQTVAEFLGIPVEELIEKLDKANEDFKG